MKKFAMFLTLSTTLVSTVSFAAAQMVDVKDSKVRWEGSKPGGSHWGYVKLKSGELNFSKSGEPESAKVVVDLNTIDSEDLTGEDEAGLVGHLKSPDFFDVAAFSEASFEATKFTKVKEGEYLVDGIMKIKDQALPEKITMNLVKKDAKTTEVKGDLNLDRTKYGVKYNSKKFSLVKLAKEKVISDEVKLGVLLVVKK